MNDFWDTLKQRAGQMDAQYGQPRFATVASYDPNTGTAQVALQPEGELSGWLPVLSNWVGVGWGIHVPPGLGDQVLVLPQEGNAEHGVIVGRAFSAQAAPPNASGAEFVIVGSAGATFSFLSNGNVVLSDRSGTSLTFENNGTLAVDGTLAVTGQIKVNGTVVTVP